MTRQDQLPFLPLSYFFRKPAGITAAAAVLVFILYSVWVLSGRYEPAVENIVSSLFLILTGTAASFFAYRITRRVRDRNLRIGWMLIAAAFAATTIGELLWYAVSLQGKDPFPSVADPFYLLYYPLFLVGISIIPFAKLEKEERITFWLDQSILLTSGFAALWYFFLHPFFRLETITLSDVLSIAYPIGDVLILASLVALTQRNLTGIASPTRILLILSVLSTAIADGFFSFYELLGTDYSLAHLNILWAASTLFCLMAAGVQLTYTETFGETLPVRQQTPPTLVRLVIPYLGTILGLVLLAWATRDISDPKLPFILNSVILLVTLFLFRQHTVLIWNERLYRQLESASERDSLTGVYNRRYLIETLEKEIHHADRYGRPLGLLILDIDGFKSYNDIHGHLMGDKVLAAVAQQLLEQTRITDILARYGGDEFVVLLPETSAEEAGVIAERIKNTYFGLPDEGLRLTVSAGSASHRSGGSAESLLGKADRVLMAQKRAIKHPDAGGVIHPNPAESNIAGANEL